MGNNSMVFPSCFALLIIEPIVATVPLVSHVAENLKQLDSMQDIEYSDKPLPQDDQESMIDYETPGVVNTLPTTTPSPPPSTESPKELEALQVVVLTPVLQTTYLANPSELAPSRSTPNSSGKAPPAGAILPKHYFSGHTDIFESEMGEPKMGEPEAEEEYPVEEEEDELLSNHGDTEQVDGTGISKQC